MISLSGMSPAQTKENAMNAAEKIAKKALTNIASENGLRAWKIRTASMALDMIERIEDEVHDEIMVALGMIGYGDKRRGATGRKMSKATMIEVARRALRP